MMIRKQVASNKDDDQERKLQANKDDDDEEEITHQFEAMACAFKDLWIQSFLETSNFS